jgi:hypothetical protein
MTMDQLITALVMNTLIAMTVAICLGVTFIDLAGVARNGRPVGRGALANYVCVPAATVGLLLLSRPARVRRVRDGLLPQPGADAPWGDPPCARHQGGGPWGERVG